MELDVIESLLGGAGAASAAVLLGVLLLKRVLQDLSRRLDRADARQDRFEREYREIMNSLNEIKIQLARAEMTSSPLRSPAAGDVFTGFRCS